MSEVINTRLARWGLVWCAPTERHIVFENAEPALFKTKREAVAFRDDRYGYIKTRKDLRAFPHYWRLPKVVKICIVLTAPTNQPNQGVTQ